MEYPFSRGALLRSPWGLLEYSQGLSRAARREARAAGNPPGSALSSRVRTESSDF